MDQNDDYPPGPGRKVRVPFRRNRGKPARQKDWTRLAAADGVDSDHSTNRENVVAKGDQSRQRTIIVREDGVAARGDLKRGVVIAMRGRFAEVDDGTRVIPCSIRRVLRTRSIAGRHPVTVGDRVHFAVAETPGSPVEGVIEALDPRRGELRRVSGKRLHTIAANVDQAIIVTSAGQPLPKPQLIDRYIVACLAGGIVPIICMNKIDLDSTVLVSARMGKEDSEEDDSELDDPTSDSFNVDLVETEDTLPLDADSDDPEFNSDDSDESAMLISRAENVLARYQGLNYRVLRTSVHTGEGIAELRSVLKDKSSVIAGQSGVGKSSLLNAIQPGLNLSVAKVGAHNEKGRHTTTTAIMVRLDFGGYVVDTPGIRSFDIRMIPKNELEALFEEFVPFVPNCKFPNCTHTHENDCAIKAAVDAGVIHPERYESYLYLFADPGNS